MVHWLYSAELSFTVVLLSQQSIDTLDSDSCSNRVNG